MVIIGVPLAVAVGVIMMICGARAAIDAERTLGAYRLVLHLICQHIESDGTWPKSWRELEKLAPKDARDETWPANASEVQSRITIDFTTTLEKVSQMTADDFPAVRQRRPYYDAADDQIQRVIDAARVASRSPVSK